MSSAESKAKAQSKAQSIILAELGVHEVSYRRLRELDYTGYTHVYLEKTANFTNMSTTAKLNIAVELAECDKPGIENL